MKKIHRFLQKNEADKDTEVITENALIHQITRVLKLKIGEEIQLFFDNDKERTVAITAIEKNSVHYSTRSTKTSLPIPKEVTAALAITKSDHFEIAAQKLSELGITRIVPLITERTIKKSISLSRLQVISDEAIELAGLTRRVRIETPIAFQSFVASIIDTPIVLLDEEGKTQTIDIPSSLIFFCGPEGGFTDEEKELLYIKNATLLQLASTTLRAETAAILGAYTLIWH